MCTELLLLPTKVEPQCIRQSCFRARLAERTNKHMSSVRYIKCVEKTHLRPLHDLKTSEHEEEDGIGWRTLYRTSRFFIVCVYGVMRCCYSGANTAPHNNKKAAAAAAATLLLFGVESGPYGASCRLENNNLQYVVGFLPQRNSVPRRSARAKSRVISLRAAQDPFEQHLALPGLVWSERFMYANLGESSELLGLRWLLYCLLLLCCATCHVWLTGRFKCESVFVNEANVITKRKYGRW